MQWLYPEEFIILIILTLHVLSISFLEETKWLGDLFIFFKDQSFSSFCTLPKFQGGWVGKPSWLQFPFENFKEEVAGIFTVPVEMTYEKVFLHLFLSSSLLILICPFLVDFCYSVFFFPGLTNSPLLFPNPCFPFTDFPPIPPSLFSSSRPSHLSLLSPWPFHTTPPTPPSGLLLRGLLSLTSRGRHHCSLFPSQFWWQGFYSNTNTKKPVGIFEFI